MPHSLPSAAQMLAELTLEQLTEARAAIMESDDDDHRLAQVWAVVEVRIAELEGDADAPAAVAA